MLRLSCKVKNYAWGKQGNNSIVAQMTKKAIEEDEHYAELWMGTHPSGPSEVVGAEAAAAERKPVEADIVTDDERSSRERDTLKLYISQHPSLLAPHEGDDIQFLFKVLSVAKALSVQSHPTKEQAAALHAKDPANYPDANHKPELAIALTDFELLAGFQKPHDILSNVKAHKELLALLDEGKLAELAHEHGEEKQRKALKAVFTQVWTSKPAEIKEVISTITQRLFAKDHREPIDELILRLNEQFPEDIGALAPLFLNHFTLKPGEACFLGPNEPHAYLSGDCMECMALSDNTIRAGLTGKFKDVRTLCDSLTYRMSGPPVFKSSKKHEGLVEYTPPVEEFAVHKLDKKASKIASLHSASILAVLSGEAMFGAEPVQKSDVLFLPQQFGCAISGQSDEFVAFRAFKPPPSKKQ